jgi:hypothetical protein
MIIVPSSAVESMNLGVIGGLSSMAQPDGTRRPVVNSG